MQHHPRAGHRQRAPRDLLTKAKAAGITDIYLNAAGLRTAGAMVFWLDPYNGEAVQATYAGVRKPVGQHLMRYSDDYVMMTYNVDPANAADRARLALSYASSLPASSRPHMLASMETHTLGSANTVSYADAVGKNAKTVVLQNRQTITNLLASYSAFAGVSLHDFVGWSAMPN
jgi:lipid-binding SYLF domain-containing protein